MRVKRYFAPHLISTNYFAAKAAPVILKHSESKKQKILLYKNKIFDKMIMHCNVHSTDRYMQTEKEIRQECIEDKDGGKQI